MISFYMFPIMFDLVSFCTNQLASREVSQSTQVHMRHVLDLLRLGMFNVCCIFCVRFSEIGNANNCCRRVQLVSETRRGADELREEALRRMQALRLIHS